VDAEPTEPIFRTPPFICVEILSSEDRMETIQQKFRLQKYSPPWTRSNVSMKRRKWLKEFVFSGSDQDARAAGFAPDAMIDAPGFGADEIAGIQRFLVDHQLAVEKM
jgi:hypothetical protein